MQQLCCVYTTWLLAFILLLLRLLVFALLLLRVLLAFALFMLRLLLVLLYFSCGFPVIFAVCLVDVS